MRKATTNQARSLRRKQPATERLLWKLLRDRRLEGLKFRRQVPIDSFVVDFACLGRRLVVGADALGVEAIGICDRNSLAGVVRAWSAKKDLHESGSTIRDLTGCRLDFADGTPSLLVYPSDREAYGRLTRLLTVGQRRAKKAECELRWADFLDHAEGQLALVVPPDRLDAAFERDLARIAGALSGNVWLAAARRYGARDLQR